MPFQQTSGTFSAPRGPTGASKRTITYLKGQKYGKRADFEEVAPVLGRVIAASELITVILISSGDCKIAGTPFDDLHQLTPGRCLRALCLMRLTNPESEIRVAGGDVDRRPGR